MAAAPASFKLHHGLARAHRLAGRPDLAIPESERAIAILDARPLAPEDVPSGPFLELGLDLWARGEQLMGDAKGPLAAGDDRTMWFEKAAVAFVRAAGVDRAYNVAYRRRSAALRGRRAEDVPDVGNGDMR